MNGKTIPSKAAQSVSYSLVASLKQRRMKCIFQLCFTSLSSFLLNVLHLIFVHRRLRNILELCVGYI